MQQSGLRSRVLNHPLAAGRVDRGEVSVVRAKSGAQWDLRGCLMEPIPLNVTHISPLSVAWFPHRRGRERGERSAIRTHASPSWKNIAWKTFPPFYNHPLSSKREKVSANLKTWKDGGDRDADVVTIKSPKINTRSCYRNTYQCELTGVKRIIEATISHLRPWQRTKKGTTRQVGNTVMFNPNTAVNREGDAAKERENTSHRMASICWQAKLQLRLEIRGWKRKLRCGDHLRL